MRVLNCHSISKLHQKVIEFQTMVAQGRRMSYDRFEVIITQHWAQYHRHLTTQPFIRRLFALFDENGDGELDFAEFHLTLASLSHGRLEERLRFAFSCIDVDGRYVYVCVCVEEPCSSLDGSALSVDDCASVAVRGNGCAADCIAVRGNESAAGCAAVCRSLSTKERAWQCATVY